MIDAVHDGRAPRRESSEHERSRGAQIRRHDLGAGQLLHAATDRAVLPSIERLAPMRWSSSACWKRFSKIVSVTTDEPSAIALSAQNWACMSVGKAGYGAVLMSTARAPASAHVEVDPVGAAVDRRAGFGELLQTRRRGVRGAFA